MPQLIGICGRAGSGKDTLADALTNSMEKAVKLPFAEPIYAGLCTLLGVEMNDLTNRATKETPLPWLHKSPRQLLQTLGTEWGRELVDDTLWLKVMSRKIDSINADIGEFTAIIPDVRFLNEYTWLKERGGILIRVIRPGINDVAQHVSEASLTGIIADIEIINATTIGNMITQAKRELKCE